MGEVEAGGEGKNLERPLSVKRRRSASQIAQRRWQAQRAVTVQGHPLLPLVARMSLSRTARILPAELCHARRPRRESRDLLLEEVQQPVGAQSCDASACAA